MKGYISEKKDLDPQPKAAGIREFGCWISGMIARHVLVIYVLVTGIVIAVIYTQITRTAVYQVDDCPAAAACSICGEPDLLLETGPPPESRKRDLRNLNAATAKQARFLVQAENQFPVFVLEEDSVTEIWTFPQSVREVLTAAGIPIGPGDRVEPEGIVHSRTEIRILRAEDEMLDAGLQSAAVRSGDPGLSRGSINVTRPESRLTSSAGVPEHDIFLPASREIKIENILEVTATAYCPGTPGSGCPLDQQGHSECTGCYNDGYTYTGKKAVQGEGTLDSPRMVAVDPRIIPLFSTVYLEGIGFAVAEDIGGAIKGNRIDLLFDLHRDASEFGLKKGIRLYVLSETG